MRPSTAELAAHIAAGMSERAIARLYGETRNVVHSWLRFRGKRPAQIRPAVEHVAFGIAIGLSERDIGRMFGVTRSCIACIRAKHGLPAAGEPRKCLAGRVWRDAKPHRPTDPAGRVRLLEDERVWFSVLAGARYSSEDPGDGGPLRRLPAEGATAQSSMRECGSW